MAAQDRITQSPSIGIPVTIPENKHDELAVLLRVLIAISASEEVTALTAVSDVSVLKRNLVVLKNNVDELANFAREIVGHG